MEIITCQYCNTEVSLVEVEKEGGACPECGAMIGGTSLFDNVKDIEDSEFDEDEFEDEDDDDDF